MSSEPQKRSEIVQQSQPPMADSFAVTEERETYCHSLINRFQSITRMPTYEAFSFEELRLNDYTMNPIRDLMPASISQHLTKRQSATISRRAPARIATSYGTNIITFHVGEEDAQDFVLHQNLITKHSTFVRKALENDWQESIERIIRLPDVEPQIFELYQQYIYGAKIFSDDRSSIANNSTEYERLVKAYILGDKLIDSVFKDNVVDTIVHRLLVTQTFDARLADIVYDNTPPRSSLRRLWTDIYVFAGSAVWINEEYVGDMIHPEFSIDLNKCHMSFSNGERPKQAPYVSSTCVYHEHAQGACYRTRSAYPRS